MTPELLASVSAILLSLLFSYIPGFKTWFEPLSSDTKRLVMLGLIALAALVSFGLSCASLLAGSAVPCTRAGAWGLFQVFIFAMISNQAAYLLTPKD